jgi:hypothetical protein
MDEPWPLWNLKEFDLAPPAREEEIAAAEARLGRALPADYAQFLRFANGGEGLVGAAYVNLDYVDRVVKTHELLHVEDSLPGHVVIGSDGGDFLYALDLTSAGTSFVMVGIELEDPIEVARGMREFLSAADIAQTGNDRSQERERSRYRERRAARSADAVEVADDATLSRGPVYVKGPKSPADFTPNMEVDDGIVAFETPELAAPEGGVVQVVDVERLAPDLTAVVVSPSEGIVLIRPAGDIDDPDVRAKVVEWQTRPHWRELRGSAAVVPHRYTSILLDAVVGQLNVQAPR